LNILQRADGSIDDEAAYILSELGAWTRICGEGLYGTRPWRTSGEGVSLVHTTDTFREDAVAWTETDFRFTEKGKTVYAFIMKAPESRVLVIRSFLPEEKISSVVLLGYGPVSYSQNYGVSTVKLPETLPTIYTNCLEIKLE